MEGGVQEHAGDADSAGTVAEPWPDVADRDSRRVTTGFVGGPRQVGHGGVADPIGIEAQGHCIRDVQAFDQCLEVYDRRRRTL